MDSLFQACFDFYKLSISPEEAKQFLHSKQYKLKMMEASDQVKFLEVLSKIEKAGDLSGPRFDQFVEEMLALQILFYQFDPTNFTPVFLQSFFDPASEDMWDYLKSLDKIIKRDKSNGKTYIPSNENAQALRYIMIDLNPILQSGEIFAESNEWENLLEL